LHQNVIYFVALSFRHLTRNIIEGLQQKRKAVAERLEQARDAGEGAWEDLKSGFQSASDAMEGALKSARSRFG
jgi:hypothetical protein